VARTVSRRAARRRARHDARSRRALRDQGDRHARVPHHTPTPPPRQRAALVLRDVLAFTPARSQACLTKARCRQQRAATRQSDARNAHATRARTRTAAQLAGRARAGRRLRGRVRERRHRPCRRVANRRRLADDAARTIRVPRPRCHREIFAMAYGVHDAGRLRLVPTRANSQPAFGFYVKDRKRTSRAHEEYGCSLLKAPDISPHRFGNNGILPAFGLPRTLPW